MTHDEFTRSLKGSSPAGCVLGMRHEPTCFSSLDIHRCGETDHDEINLTIHASSDDFS